MDAAGQQATQQTVFITGTSGFVGSHLVQYLLNHPSHQIVIHGLSHQADHNVASLPAQHSRLFLHQLNLEDTSGIAGLMEKIRPDLVFHLAAQSLVGPAIRNPGLTLNTNINLTLSLFEAVRQAGLTEHTRILNVGSSDQYGFITPADLPVRETTPFRPGNPYAVSKIAQEMLGYQYFRSYRMHIVNTRAFNHLGPHLSTGLAAGSFAHQVARAEAGLAEPLIHVGNLEATRDYLDVRDIVRGYWLALTQDLPGYPGCQPGEAYNLCSGQDRSIAAVLDALIKMARCRLVVHFDQERMRPSDLPCVRGDFSKFHQATGWQPEIAFEQSLRDLLDSWRAEVRRPD